MKNRIVSWLTKPLIFIEFEKWMIRTQMLILQLIANR